MKLDVFIVTVPPNIDDSQSSSDAIVREGANVTLTCKATGSPTPNIRWKRDDGSKISINKTLSGNINFVNNETLRFDKRYIIIVKCNGVIKNICQYAK